jgi:hypothetical protein
MAIIPRANPADVTQISSLPGVRNTSEVRPVSGMADAITGVAGQALRIHEDAVARNDATAVMAARRQLSDWEAHTFDPSNPDGITKYQGGNALGASDALMPDLDKTVAGISDRLTPRQRRAFDAVAFNFRDSVQGRLTAHMTREHETFLQQQDEATQTSLLNDAVSVSLGGDYATGRQRLDEGVSAIALSMGHRGAPAQAIAQAQQKYVSGYHAAMLDSMLSSDPSQAQAYFGDHEKEMTVDDRLRVERVLRPVATEANARNLVDSWVKGGATPAAGQPVEGAARTPAEVEAVARASVERTVGLESGGKADAKNPASSATGSAQFVDGTWLDVMTRYRPDLTAGKSRAQVLALRNDPALSKEMATAYAIENCKGLYESGLPVTPETAYLCHHFGLAGARNLLRADPNTPVRDVLDPQAYAANGYLQGKTVADLLHIHAGRAGDAPGPVAPGPRALTPEGKPDFAALAARAQALPNPLLRDAALREISQRETLQNRAEQDYRESMVTALNQAVETVPPGTPYEKAFTPDQLAYARDHGLVDNLQARLKARAAGTLVQSDPVLLDAYLRESVTDPRTFATRKAEILAHADKLATADLHELVARIDTLNDPKKQGEAADWSTEAQRLNGGLRMLGIDPASKAAADKEKAAGFGMAYRQAKRALIETLGGKKPTPEQEETLMRNVTRNWAADIAAGRKPWIGAKAQENLAAGAPMTDNAGNPVQLTAQDRVTVAAVLRRRLGREPTEAQILAAAGSYLAGGGR